MQISTKLTSNGVTFFLSPCVPIWRHRSLIVFIWTLVMSRRLTCLCTALHFSPRWSLCVSAAGQGPLACHISIWGLALRTAALTFLSWHRLTGRCCICCCCFQLPVNHRLHCNLHMDRIWFSQFCRLNFRLYAGRYFIPGGKRSVETWLTHRLWHRVERKIN